MAPRAMAVGLALALIAISWGQASAQTSGCTTAIISLAPCLGYITGNSSSPSSSCCSQLASVVQNQASCLCTVLNGGAASSIGITVNQTQALALPGACNVKTPPVSQCNAAAPSSPTSPATETPSTPKVPSSSSPAVPSTPSVPSGSKTVPSSTSSESSDGGFSKSSRSVIVAVFFLVACVSSLAGV